MGTPHSAARLPWRALFLSGLLLVLPSLGIAECHVLLGRGGDRNEDYDKKDSAALADMYDQEKRIDPGIQGSSEQLTTAGSLREKLVALRDSLHCGDELKLFLVGHGGRDRFLFAKDESRLTAEELLALLDGFDCCVGVHVVISACYSGSFIDDLSKSSHVLSVFTSTNSDHVGYKGWNELFLEGLQDVPSGSPQIEALQTAAGSALDKTERWWEEVVRSHERCRRTKDPDVCIGSRPENEPKPQSFVSEEGKSYRVYGHVEKVTPDPEGVVIELRLSADKVVKVLVKRGSRVQIGPDPVDLSALHECQSAVAYGDKVGEQIVALGVRVTDMKVRVHIPRKKIGRGKSGLELDLLTDDHRKVRIRFTDEQYKKLAYCQWWEVDGPYQEGGVVVARELESIPAPPRNVTVHIEVVAPDTLCWYVKDTNGTKGKVILQPGMSYGYEVCNWVEVAGRLKEPDDDLVGMGEIVAEQVKKVPPPEVTVVGHIVNRVESKDTVWLAVRLSGAEEVVLVRVRKGARVRLNGVEVEIEELRVCLDVTVTGGLVRPGGPVVASTVEAVSGSTGKDAGADHILAPVGQVRAHTPALVGLLVRNYGTDTIPSCPVVCVIDSAGRECYRDSTKLATPIPPTATADALFRPWVPGSAGASYRITFHTLVDGDQNPANDTLGVTVAVADSARGNVRPTLTTATMTPGYGDTTTLFTLGIVYTDQDGDYPTTSRLRFMTLPDTMGATFKMKPVSGTPVTGAVYQCRVALRTPGNYYHVFEFDDGHGHAVGTGPMPGPAVLVR